MLPARAVAARILARARVTRTAGPCQGPAKHLHITDNSALRSCQEARLRNDHTICEPGAVLRLAHFSLRSRFPGGWGEPPCGGLGSACIGI